MTLAPPAPRTAGRHRAGEPADMLRVLVTGGRHFADRELLFATLDLYPIIELAHGAAPGADTLADEYAKMRDITPVRYPADWEAPCTNQCKPGHRRRRRDGKTYCPAAGVYRNDDMLWDFGPDLVIAFPGGPGTADMVQRAVQALGRDRVVLIP